VQDKKKQMALLILTEISYFIIATVKEEKTETEHANKNGWNVDRESERGYRNASMYAKSSEEPLTLMVSVY
jgi:hypothetical protein